MMLSHCLSEAENCLKGIKSLRARASEGVMVCATDKSGRLAVTSEEKYVTSMQPHIKDEAVVTMKDRHDTERTLNGHTLQLGRILGVGENHRHWPRVKSALRNRSGHVPTLYGLIKDHKPVSPGSAPPMRPVCGADDSGNGQLSRLLSDIVTAVADRVDRKVNTVCRSTEEMIAAIEEVNMISGKEDIVVFSTDVHCYKYRYLQLLVEQ